ncbi:MAG: hypothetical protein H7A36_03070 [Chlamydiales bacterium]|nr:hypothetical protein [Chlamydiales bacterium]
MRYLLAICLLFSPLFAEELLFVLHAKEARYDGGDLILEDIDNTVTYFTQPPQRQAGKMVLSKFLEVYFKQKRDIEAGFVFFSDDGRHYTDVPITVLRAHYDETKRRLYLRIDELSKDHPLGKKMEEVNLFIDHIDYEGAL